jgi:hypothetical protein
MQPRCDARHGIHSYTPAGVSRQAEQTAAAGGGVSATEVNDLDPVSPLVKESRQPCLQVT